MIDMNKTYKRRGCGTVVRILATDVRDSGGGLTVLYSFPDKRGGDLLIRTAPDGRFYGGTTESPNDLIEVQPRLFGYLKGDAIFAIREAFSDIEYKKMCNDWDDSAVIVELITKEVHP